MMTIDLHHKFVDEAYELLLNFIDDAIDKKETLIKVIHGYNRGSKLREMVLGLSEKDHDAINHVQSEINNSGTTYIYLKFFD